MKDIITNKRGETHINTAVKIIIAVVIGALLLGGLFVVFASEDGILNTASNEVAGLMDYTQELRYERYFDEDTEKYTIRYSYDGRHWYEPEMPNYGEGSSVYGVMSNNSEDNPIEVALIQNASTYYVLTSTDGGITWSEKLNFTGNGIDQFYFREANGENDAKFIIRVWKGGQTYFTIGSYGDTWSMPYWSDIIRPN